VGVVESSFVRPAYLGESVAPFRVLESFEAVLPYDGTELMDGESDRLGRYPGLAAWWSGAETIWNRNRRTDKRTLRQQIDYIGQLRAQFPVSSHRVVYTASGNTIAAALLNDPRGVVEHKLYWGAVSSVAEGRYLCAVLNAPVFTRIVGPYQSVGAFGARDFDKYVWMPPTPMFDPGDDLHQRLVALAEDAERIASGIDRTMKGFKADRTAIRRALADAGVAGELDKMVEELLADR
jgi:hypothetical protein